MAIQLQREFQFSKIKAFPLLHYCNGNTNLIIKLPQYSKLLKILARFMALVLIFISFPMFGAYSLLFSPPNTETAGPNSVHLDILPSLSIDLVNEGLIKTGDKAIFISNGDDSQILNNNHDMDFISVNELGKKRNIISNESLDFAITYSFNAVQESQEFIDRTLKIGGLAVIRLSDNPSFTFNKLYNYKIVYLRKFQSNIVMVAMRKTSAESWSSQRKLFAYTSSEARKEALNNLEDVLLEPPRAASGKSSRYLKKTRYLPDLMGDSLEGYPRRVFIDVGLPENKGGSGTRWFAKNYPTRNLHFEMYKIETLTEKEVQQVVVEQIVMSDWLRKSVKEEEYVVMKAEAEVVEEMIESKAISLVDELFMECKPRGHGGRRAYWECLALYGRLRDLGVAVHQWWG